MSNPHLHDRSLCASYPLQEINPEKNGGRLTPISLVPGFDLVFLHQPGHALALHGMRESVRLFGDPLLEALEVTEISEGGSVPFLKTTNGTPFDVLFIAGQLVKGGKQNRGLNTDILVAAGETARIPVTCVEQGRWSGGLRSRFRHGGFEPTSIRASKMRDVHQSRRHSGEFHARQDEVWSEIADMSKSFGVRNPSSDLLHAAHMRLSRASEGARSGGDSSEQLRHLEHRRQTLRDAARELLAATTELVSSSDIDALSLARRRLDSVLRELTLVERELERLSPPAGSTADPAAFVPTERIAAANEAARGAGGMLVFFNGEFVAGDIFGSGEWFARLYGDLRDSALLSWEHCMTRRRDRSINPLASSIAEASARKILGETCDGRWIDRPAVASGRSQLLEHPYLDGAVLLGRDEAPLHVIVGTKAIPEFLRR